MKSEITIDGVVYTPKQTTKLEGMSYIIVRGEIRNQQNLYAQHEQQRAI